MALLIYGPFERLSQHNTNTYLDALAEDHQELAEADAPVLGEQR